MRCSSCRSSSSLGGVWLLDLYVQLEPGQLLRILAVTEAAGRWSRSPLALRLAFRLLRPADPWLRGERTPETALAAWRALAGLPLDLLRYALRPAGRAEHRADLDLPRARARRPVSCRTLLVLMAGAARRRSLYGVFLRFFATELALRPVLARRLAATCPTASDLGRATVPLRWRLLVALPVINVITGVAVAGLSSDGPSLRDASGVGVLVALGVAFTISLELSLLLLRSIVGPIDDLRRGDRARRGRRLLRARAGGSAPTRPAGSPGSFNQMVAGLQERERLREAFGAFVDPGLAERVLAGGHAARGRGGRGHGPVRRHPRLHRVRRARERARGRRPAQRASSTTSCRVLVHHGGHANKFVGDGLLGVFGAPDRLPDHADRAVEAALRDRRGRPARPTTASCGSASASTRDRSCRARSAAAGASSSRSSATR